MTLSVLMSVYKSEHPSYLERALLSIWDDQVRKPDKIVLVQDGPVGKELAEVLSQWKKKLGDSLLLIVNPINIGLTKSLNIGIKHISTDYIARMDSDDISMPDRFAKQMSFLEKNDFISIVGCNIQEFSDSCDCLRIRKFPRDTEGAIASIFKANPLAHPAVMMRRKIFDDGISYNEAYRTSQDLALWFDVLAAGYKIANMDDVLLKFRRNDDVYKRRSNLKDRNLELLVHERGIRKLYGISPIKSLFPLARYVMKFLPKSMIRSLYDGEFRNKLVKI